MEKITQKQYDMVDIILELDNTAEDLMNRANYLSLPCHNGRYDKEAKTLSSMRMSILMDINELYDNLIEEGE